VGVALMACGPGASGGGATGPTAAPVGNATQGQTKFVGTCSSCHGPEARGLPGLGKDLHNNAFVKSQTDAQLLAFIQKGRPASDPANTTKVDMPPRGGNPALKDSDINDIIAYIRTLQ
jgi:disulfide bond formation protein DsbB